VRQTPASEAVEGNEATATLTVSAPDSPEATLSASWTTAGSLALAEISGSVGSEQVLATVPAP
jgi:hypothetical protein